MVSRQETARPLLTQGEVMQLPPADELVLVSGMAPIRAKKLRYYEDRNFRERRAPPPNLHRDRSGNPSARSAGAYPDRPPLRPDDWTGLTSAPDARLARSENDQYPEDDGGRHQQRAPDIEEVPARPQAPRQLDLLGLDRDDADPAADKRAMDQARPASAVVRAHALNQGRDADALPSF